MRYLLAALLVVLGTAGANAYTVAEIARVDRLLATLDRRLAISEQVARAKWSTGAPIEDLAREAQVLDRFAQEALAAGLDGERARAVMRAQIEASKIRQRELFTLWRSQRRPPFSTPPDLAAEIRPRLDELSRRLLANLGEVEPLLTSNPDLVKWRAALLWESPLDPARAAALQPFLPGAGKL